MSLSYDIADALKSATEQDLTLQRHSESVVKAALMNAITVAAYNLGGRTRITAADVRLYDALSSVVLRHFGSSPAEAGDHIPPEREEPPTQLISALEDALEIK